MSMYLDMLTDQENTIIVLCEHMKSLLTLLSAYIDTEEAEKEWELLRRIEKKVGAE